MKLSEINKKIIAAARKHFRENHGTKAAGNKVLCKYYSEQYGITMAEAAMIEHSEDEKVEDIVQQDFFCQWYYHNYVETSIVKPKKAK